MDLDEPPRSNLQLPKIGGQGASAASAIVPKGPAGPGPRQKSGTFKQPPVAVVRERYAESMAKAGDLPAPEARQRAREEMREMFPEANLDELLPPLEPVEMRLPADFDGDDNESLPPLEPSEEPPPITNTDQPANAHPVTRHDLGFGHGTEDTEQFATGSDPGSHTPTQ
eukprot:11892157-Karenia_brevis.AAC.1